MKLHDYGCSLKAYRREVIQDIRLYGEMHRFVPIYATWNGGRVCEVVVQHNPRRHGKSKYGLSRIYKVLLDLIVVKFLTHYNTKPIYIFGGVGIISFFISMLSGFYAVYLKFFSNTSLILTPLPLLTVFSFITGLMCVLMGLLAEMLVRIYFEAQGKPIYFVKSRYNFAEP